jgi:hypothetical protein
MAITKGTAVAKNVTVAATSGVSAAFSSGADALLLCGIVTDDNGTNTSVSSVVISGSPTYTTAWQRVPTNGRAITANTVNVELWYAVASSAIVAQTVTVTNSSSERFGFVIQSYTGIDTANPIPNSANATTTTGAATTLSTASIPYNGSGNSLYAGWLGVGSDLNTNVAPNASYTQDGAINDAAGVTLWVHGLYETLTAAVTSAQVVNATFTAIAGSGNAASLIGVEIKEAGAGGAVTHFLASMGMGT